LKFLIVKLSAIGDVIHALPVAAYLKQAVPGCRVSWMVEQAAASLVSNNPAIDEVIVFNGKKWLRELGKPQSWLKNMSESERFFASIRDAKYDAVLELQGLLKSSVLARASGAKVVAGFDDTREFADRFLTHKLNVGDYFGHDVPVVELNLKVARHALKVLGVPDPEPAVKFPLPELSPDVHVKATALLLSPVIAAPSDTGSIEWVDGPLRKLGTSESAGLPLGTSGYAGVPPEPYAPKAPSSLNRTSDLSNTNPINIVLIPGTTWVTKIWPNAKWIELGQMLSDRYRCQLVLVGGPAESDANASITTGIEASRPNQLVLNLTGLTTLIDLIGIFKKSSLVIGADTGPLHLASATDSPKVIGVFGSTPAKRNGPYGPQCETVHLNLECQPCYSKTCKYATVACLTDLDSFSVMDAAIRLMS
jgi:heptosyltransferase I